MDIFRGIIFAGEVSERSFTLTEALLDLNPANYTVWYTLNISVRTIFGDISTWSGNIVANASKSWNWI
jgi:hypothetical protein